MPEPGPLANPPAEVTDLGSPEQVFASLPKWQRSMLGPVDQQFLLGWIMLAGSAVILLLIPAIVATKGPWWVSLAALGSVVLFALMAAGMFAERTKGMPGTYGYLLCPAGLGYFQDGTWTAIRWDQAAAFRSSPMEIVGNDERIIPLRRGVTQAHTLLTTVERRVVQQVYRRARAALTAGETVSFGPLSISPTGLLHAGELLPWSELEAVEVSLLVPQGATAVDRPEVDERIWVIQTGGRTWCALLWSAILTRTVLAKLIQEECPHARTRYTLDEEAFRT
jgi:hypothetical protein